MKWDKLNKKLDDVLNDLTQEDWIKWEAEKDFNKQQREEDRKRRAEIQEQKLIWDQINLNNIAVLIPHESYLFDENILQQILIEKGTLNNTEFFFFRKIAA